MSITRAGPGQRPGNGLALAVIVSCQLLIGVDATIVNVALPKIQRSLHFDTADLAWVLNAYTLVFAGLLLLGGRLGDVFGRRRLFVVGVAVFTMASLLGALAPDAGWLLAARALQGVGAAMASPSTLALIANTFAEGPARNRALAISSSVISAGASLGLVLGGVITSVASWRWVLLVNVPIGLIVAVLAARTLHEPQRRPGRFDIAGAATVTAAMGSVVYGLIRAATVGWADGVVLVALGAGVLLLGAFIGIEARVAAPITPLTLFADRNRAAAYGSILLVGASLIGPFFFLTTFLQQVRGFTALQTGLAFLPMTGGLFAAARVVPRLLGRFSAKPVIVTGTGLLVVGSLLLAQLDAGTPYLTGIFGPLLIIGVSGGCVFIPLYTLILAGIDGRDAGAASGVLQTMQWLSGALGLAALVAIAGTVHGPFEAAMSRAFQATAVLATVALIVALVVVRRPAARPALSEAEPALSEAEPAGGDQKR